MEDTFVEDALRKAKLTFIIDDVEGTIRSFRDTLFKLDMDDYAKAAISHHLDNLESGIKTHVALFEAISIMKGRRT